MKRNEIKCGKRSARSAPRGEAVVRKQREKRGQKLSEGEANSEWRGVRGGVSKRRKRRDVCSVKEFEMLGFQIPRIVRLGVGISG